MTTASATIADWISRTSIGALPDAVVQNARLRLLDIAGVMLAARHHPIVRSAESAATFSDPGTGARVLGSSGPCSASAAALINGTMATALEFDDTYLPTTMHATALSAAVGFVEPHLRRVSGARLIEATALSSELMIRLSIVPPVNWFAVGLHPTGLFSVFGGVAALARLRGLPPADTVAAMGIAGSMSAGINASFQDGSFTKSLHVGLGAANAHRAVALARAGISGPVQVFEGKFGWYRSHVQTTDARRYATITDDLGQDWKVLEIASKQYPVAFPLMPQIEAALSLRSHPGFDIDAITAIEAHIAAPHHPTLCEPPEVKRRPRTPWHGRISLPHTIAEALVTGRMDKNAFAEHLLADPRINALADKVTHTAGTEGQTQGSRSGARIVVRMQGGREIAAEVADMRGTVNNPAGVEDYLRKFRANVGDILPADRVERLIADFLALDRVENVAEVLERMVP